MRKRERGRKTTALTRTVKRMLETSSFSRRTFARHVAAGCREHAKWSSWLVGSVKARVCTSPGRTMEVRDVEGDSRRVRIFAKYVREECHGRLPRTNDSAELAGWEREDAGVARVRVGQWWYDFSRRYDGARKKRVEESARDEETQQALRDLAQCEKRNVRDVQQALRDLAECEKRDSKRFKGQQT